MVVSGRVGSFDTALPAAGCAALLVETPFSARERCQPDHCVNDLTEAAAWIVETFALRGVT